MRFFRLQLAASLQLIILETYWHSTFYYLFVKLCLNCFVHL